MNLQLLERLLGTDGRWTGPCVVVLDADASVQPISNDSILQGGVKSFAPRLITGRVSADAIRLSSEFQSLFLVQTTVIRQQTGEDIIKKNLVIIDTGHVAAIEFTNLEVLGLLGITAPE